MTKANQSAFADTDFEAVAIAPVNAELRSAAGTDAFAVVLPGTAAEDGAAVAAGARAFAAAVRTVGAAIDHAGIDRRQALAPVTEVGVVLVQLVRGGELIDPVARIIPVAHQIGKTLHPAQAVEEELPGRAVVARLGAPVTALYFFDGFRQLGQHRGFFIAIRYAHAGGAQGITDPDKQFRPALLIGLLEVEHDIGDFPETGEINIVAHADGVKISDGRGLVERLQGGPPVIAELTVGDEHDDGPESGHTISSSCSVSKLVSGTTVFTSQSNVIMERSSDSSAWGYRRSPPSMA